MITTWWLFLGFMVGVQGGTPAKTDHERLQGSCMFVAAERDGEKVPEEQTKRWKLTIEGDKIRFLIDGKVEEQASFALDASRKPKTIDITHLAGAMKGKKALGIYEVDGETLRFSFTDPGRDRPTEFRSKPSSGQEFIVLKRVQPG